MIISSGDLVRRNAAFAATGAFAGLPFPTSDTLQVLGCVDSRVDPSDVLGLELGEGVVMRNIGGRITPATLRSWALLGRLGQGQPPRRGHLVVLHHTDCGITRLTDYPEQLAAFFEIPADELDSKAVADPYAAVRVDTAIARHALPPSRLLSGLVYDVTTTSVLFDTGLSPDAMVTNAGRLGLDLSAVHAVVLSHGHFDHAGGLAGLAARRGTRSLPMIVHPLVWTRRRLALPGGGADDWPTLSKHALTGEGFDVIERRQPSLLVDGSILITGEVDRTTDFEHGMPPAHQHWTGTTWEPDPLILDDQALVANVRGKGLVIVTGCGHAGAVNIVRHAQRLTGVPRLHALLGGLHLGGAFFTPSIGPTVHALTELAPDLLVPGHCTGGEHNTPSPPRYPTAGPKAAAAPATSSPPGRREPPQIPNIRTRKDQADE